LELPKSAKASNGGKIKIGFGAIRTNPSAAGGNSIFKTGAMASDFFSDLFPTAIALHSRQGCLPSKVWDTASVSDCWLARLDASIVVHATVCSAAQCHPVESTSARTTRHFPKRATTGLKFIKDPAKSRRSISPAGVNQRVGPEWYLRIRVSNHFIQRGGLWVVG